MQEKLNISAVHEKELRDILDANGLTGFIETGQLRCTVCDDVLSWETIGGFIVQQGRPVFFCSLPECIGKTRKA